MCPNGDVRSSGLTSLELYNLDLRLLDVDSRTFTWILLHDTDGMASSRPKEANIHYRIGDTSNNAMSTLI